MSEYLEFQANRRVVNTAHSYFGKQTNTLYKSDLHEQQRALKLFRDQVGASINLAFKDKSCCQDDNFLNRFLYAKKFQSAEAMQLLISYLLFKSNNKTVLEKISIFDENIQLALRDGNPGILKQRDRRGRKVITFTASNWDPLKYSLEDVFRALLLSLDKLLENVQNQALGFVVIVDWTNFTLRQSSHLSPRILKLMIEGLQESFPAKFKGIHFISQPWYVDVALTVIKPFLNEKTKKRIVIHGTNLANLHNLISKDILPPDLGGEGPSTNNLDWYHYLIESSQMTETPKSYRLIEAAVYSTAKKNVYVIESKDNTMVNAVSKQNLNS